MFKVLPINRNLISFGIPLILFGVLMVLMKSSYFTSNLILNLSITIDLLIGIPFIYFILIRKSKIPKTTVIPIMVVGLVLGSYFLPKENQIYLSLFKTWVLPFVELFVLTFIIVKVYGITKKYKTLKEGKPDFFDTVKCICQDILPEKLVSPFATEIAVFYYGFFSWRKLVIKKNEFTYHKNSGALGMMIGILMIIAVETVALHFLLTNWNRRVAWGVTILSIYTAIQVFGLAKSLSKRLIIITDSGVVFKYGIASEAKVLFDNIESIELSKVEDEKEGLTKTLSPLGELEGHNVVVKLKFEHEITGIYGCKKKFKTLLLFIDEPLNFKVRLDNFIKKN